MSNAARDKKEGKGRKGGSLAGEYTEFEIYPTELTINLVPRR